MANRFPPLWQIPIFLRYVPLMLWYHRRGQYLKSMAVARKVMGSPKIKSRAFRDYTPTEHDVFVCTYSKSGTYWMLQIVTQIAGLGSAEFEHIHDLVPWPETPSPGPVHLKQPTWQSSPSKIRAVKTHAEAQFVPYNDQARYIIVLRDPKDVLVSSFHFSESILPGIASIGAEVWTDTFAKSETPYGSWPEHVASYWAWRDRPNVKFVTFAEMKSDLDNVVRDVAAWMGVELTIEALAQTVMKSSFAYMKQHEAQFAPPTPSGKSNLIRSGEVGESAEFLTAAQRQQVDNAMRQQLKQLGSDFPYDQFFP